ncbi:dynein heavy chain 12, axonemal-like [Limulus polyphemus]|uniref:Dynein heavy chain 12, axonemal-like n=1 Tax=Limulus polyphemus TaxID=6850 RepID=A0ABM1SL01_LIMPO|nr:dynein heavy chain 12, axonemal-like [Limulus polyphemus]
MASSHHKLSQNIGFVRRKKECELPGLEGLPLLPPIPSLKNFPKDRYKNSKLLNFRLFGEKQKEQQRKLEQKAKRIQRWLAENPAPAPPPYPGLVHQQEFYVGELKKSVASSPIASLPQQWQEGILKRSLSFHKSSTNLSPVIERLLADVEENYVKTMRKAAVNHVFKVSEEQVTKSKQPQILLEMVTEEKQTRFMNTRKILENKLHIMHPTVRKVMDLTKCYLSKIQLIDISIFYSQRPIDLEDLDDAVIAECGKTESKLMQTWWPEVSAVLANRKALEGLKGDKRKSLLSCIDTFITLQARHLSSVK